MNLVCIGSSHRACPVEVREKIAFPNSKISSALEAMRDISGLKEWFLLSTCNRVELYGVGPENIHEDLIHFLGAYHAIPKEHFMPYLYQHSGRCAAEHLFRVASGLDSMVVGEHEIYHQIESVFETSRQLETVGPFLNPLMEHALHVGRRIRKETKISEGAVNVASVAVSLAKELFEKLGDKKVLVLGTGVMSAHTIRNLLKSGASQITISNRTYEHAKELAEKFNIHAVPFNEWWNVFSDSDIVISSTAAPHAIIHYAAVQELMNVRKDKPLFIIDIAVPRDAEPEIAKVPGVHLYDIDDLKTISDKNLELRKNEVTKCELILEKELKIFDNWYELLRKEQLSLKDRIQPNSPPLSDAFTH